MLTAVYNTLSSPSPTLQGPTPTQAPAIYVPAIQVPALALLPIVPPAKPQIPMSTTLTGPKTVLPNGIMIYGALESETVRELTAVIEAFPNIWTDLSKFVDLPKDE